MKGALSRVAQGRPPKLPRCELYVDVNNICDVGCAHCMYQDRQGSTALSLPAGRKTVLHRLARESDHVSVSGEGEPLRTPGLILEVLSAVQTGVPMVVITSGDAPWAEVEDLLNQLSLLGEAKKANIVFRLSIDRWHYARVRYRNYLPIVRWFGELEDSSRLCLAFRGVLSDRSNVSRMLRHALTSGGLAPTVESVSPLRDKVTLGGRSWPVIYRQHVLPEFVRMQLEGGILAYIGAYERTHGRRFFLGCFDPLTGEQGVSLTVKPDGRVQLYGLDPMTEWSLGDADLSVAAVRNTIRSRKDLAAPFVVPLREVLDALSHEEVYQGVVKSASNPYWLMRALHEADPTTYKRILANLI